MSWLGSVSGKWVGIWFAATVPAWIPVPADSADASFVGIVVSADDGRSSAKRELLAPVSYSELLSCVATGEQFELSASCVPSSITVSAEELGPIASAVDVGEVVASAILAPSAGSVALSVAQGSDLQEIAS